MKNTRTGRLGGFTLIELLVVVLIIGILAAVALPQYQVAVGKSRVSALLPLMRAIDSAEQIYFLANGSYTKVFGDLSIEMPSGGSFSQADDRVTYDNFYCYLHGTNPFLSLTCQENTLGLNIERYFKAEDLEDDIKDAWAICWAQNDNSVKQKICKSISHGEYAERGAGFAYKIK